MTSKETGFYAYAATTAEIGQVIEHAVKAANSSNRIDVQSWKALDIPGHFISEKVLKGIANCTFLVVDISVLNFNVTYEIGYAIGKAKRILLTKNKSVREGSVTIKEVGIFDTLGYSEHQNSAELSEFINSANHSAPLNIPNKINIKSPAYLLEGMHKTDWASRIVSRIKKARYLSDLLIRMSSLDYQPMMLLTKFHNLMASLFHYYLTAQLALKFTT